MRASYALLAVVGLVGTWWFNLQHRGSAGDFVTGVFATPASSSIGVDIAVVGIAASAWIIVESRRLGMRWAWLLVPLSAVTALAFTLPVFLAWREHRLRALAAQPGGRGTEDVCSSAGRPGA